MKTKMHAGRKYRLEKIEQIKVDLFFENNKLLIALSTILFVGVMILLHQTGIIVMVAGR